MCVCGICDIMGDIKMKIRVTEYTTEIEADARELRESNTLGGNIALMLSRCFKSSEPFEDKEEEKGEENE